MCAPAILRASNQVPSHLASRAVVRQVFVPGYAYTVWNFAGINVSVFGSVVYSYVRHIERNR